MPSVSRVPRGGGAADAIILYAVRSLQAASRWSGRCSPVAAACTMLLAVVWTLPSGTRRGNQGVAQPSL